MKCFESSLVTMPSWSGHTSVGPSGSIRHSSFRGSKTILRACTISSRCVCMWCVCVCVLAINQYPPPLSDAILQDKHLQDVYKAGHPTSIQCHHLGQTGAVYTHTKYSHHALTMLTCTCTCIGHRMMISVHVHVHVVRVRVHVRLGYIYMHTCVYMYSVYAFL